MREIKFRAWFFHPCWTLVNTEQGPGYEGKWVMGDVVCLYLYLSKTIWVRPDGRPDKTRDVPLGDLCVLREFTGLRDKNGKEIYEGDIVRIDGGGDIVNAEVFFEDGCFCILAPWIKKDAPRPELKHYVGMEFCAIEVIGNIHENPELLRQ